MKRSTKTRGFTLIELLVVVLIIGILSAVALPQYTKAVEKARAAEAVLMVRDLSQAADAYLLASGYSDEADISGSLDITPASSEKFNSTIGITDSRCSITITQVAGHFELGASKVSGASWEKTCTYFDEAGEGVCKGLEANGYTMSNGSGPGLGIHCMKMCPAGSVLEPQGCKCVKLQAEFNNKETALSTELLERVRVQDAR